MNVLPISLYRAVRLMRLNNLKMDAAIQLYFNGSMILAILNPIFFSYEKIKLKNFIQRRKYEYWNIKHNWIHWIITYMCIIHAQSKTIRNVYWLLKAFIKSFTRHGLWSCVGKTRTETAEPTVKNWGIRTVSGGKTRFRTKMHSHIRVFFIFYFLKHIS